MLPKAREGVNARGLGSSHRPALKSDESGPQRWLLCGIGLASRSARDQAQGHAPPAAEGRRLAAKARLERPCPERSAR